MMMAWAAGIDLSLPSLPVHALPLLRSRCRPLPTRRGEYGCRNANTVCDCCFPGRHLAMAVDLIVCPTVHPGGCGKSAAASRSLAGRHRRRQDVRHHLRLLSPGWRPPCGQRSKTVEVRAQRRIHRRAFKKGKVGAMPAYGSVFSEGQIIAILAYIRGLDD